MPALLLAAVTCALLVAAWSVARSLVAEDAPLRARVAAALTSALFLQCVAFNLLEALRLFRAPVVVGLAAVLALGVALRFAGSLPRRAAFAHDLNGARAAVVASLRDPVSAGALLGGGGIVAFRVLRGTVSPPLAWDALTYHLVRPALWVQHGYDLVERAPDQIGYLTFFPRGGDVPWAWSMLLTRSTGWVPLSGALIWAIVPVAAAVLARELGASTRGAVRAGLGVGLIPCLVNISTSGYVDNFVVASWLLAGFFIARCLRGVGGGELLLAAMALSVHAGAKLSGIPLFALGLVVSTAAWRRRGDRPTRPRAHYLAAASGLAAAALLPAYARTLRATGSPLWPLALKLGRRTLVAGNEQLALLYAARLQPPAPDALSPWRFFEDLMLPKPRHLAERLDWGEQLAWVAPMALVALWTIARERERGRRGSALLLLLLSAVPLAAVFSDDLTAQRTIWGPVVGRLVVALPVMLYVLAARCEGPLATAGWAMVFLSSLHTAWPMGTSAPARGAMLTLAPAFAIAVASVGLAALGPGTRRRATRIALALTVSSLLLGWRVEALRARFRWPIYEAAARPDPGAAFELHPLGGSYVDAWPVWRFLDDGAPHRLAVAFGWDGIGHNVYRLPLFGSRFQNAVSYIPVTADGAVVDQHDPSRAHRGADVEAWLRRLDEGRVEYVVTLHPGGIEREWIEARPRRFTPAASAGDRRHVVWRVLR
jgi:hypothetical protein